MPLLNNKSLSVQIVIPSFILTRRQFPYQLIYGGFAMNSTADFSPIATLDLAPIKSKLMHELSGEGWSLEHTEAVEREYRRFLFLMKEFPYEHTAPLIDVDIFWHYHILDTVKYAADCERVFGYFLHHDPYNGLGDEDNRLAHQRSAIRMRQLYEEEFNEAYGARLLLAAHGGSDSNPADAAGYCGASVDTSYCGLSTAAASRIGSARSEANTSASAYCGASKGSAYCGASKGSAYCGASKGSAYCGASKGAAYCGAANGAAYCGKSSSSGPQVREMSTDRWRNANLVSNGLSADHNI
jgi:hypothetical protein